MCGLVTLSAKPTIPMLHEGTVRRERVDQLLDAAVARARLTVVQAPAGYGKTTAVSGWLLTGGRPAGWVAVERFDNEPGRLIGEIVRALGTMLGDDALAGVRRSLAGRSDLGMTVIPALADALKADAPPGLVLVLDDYHLIGDETARTNLGDLLDVIGEAMRVVVISRTRPALRLGRRLTAGEAVVICADQLAFEPAEAQRLLRDAHGLELSEDDLRLALRRAHGWAAGLELLATALELAQQEGVSSVAEALGSLTRGALLDYVVDEMLSQAGDPQRDFLLHTAVLPRINGPLAAAVTGDPHAYQLLEELREQRQFVINEPGGGDWLRVHELIRQTLLVFLQRREPGVAQVLRLRAAKWLEQHGHITEAIGHAIASGDAPSVERLLHTHGFTLWIERRTPILRRALDLLLAAPAAPDPFVQALDAVTQWQEGIHPLLIAPLAWNLHESWPARRDVRALTSLLVSTPFLGEIKRSIAAGREAVGQFADVPQLAERIAQAVAFSLLWEGHPEEVRAIVEPIAASGGRSGRGVVDALLCGACLIEQDAIGAERHGRRAVQYLHASGLQTAAEFAIVRGGWADALRLVGKLKEARANLQVSLALEERRPGSPMLARLLLADAELSLAEGNPDRARRRLRASRAIFDRFPDIGARIRDWLTTTEETLTTTGDRYARGSALTPTELRILRALEQTPSRSEIAHQLGVTENTIKSHLNHIYRRLGAQNRAAALTTAHHRGLLT